jgi:hypothetical protein
MLLPVVMAGLVPAIHGARHDGARRQQQTWITGTSPMMTTMRGANL